MSSTATVYAIFKKKESLDGKYAPKYSFVYSTFWIKMPLARLYFNRIMMEAADKEWGLFSKGIKRYIIGHGDSFTVGFSDQDNKEFRRDTYTFVQLEISWPNAVNLRNMSGHVVCELDENEIPHVVAYYGVRKTYNSYHSGKAVRYCFNIDLDKNGKMTFHS